MYSSGLPVTTACFWKFARLVLFPVYLFLSKFYHGFIATEKMAMLWKDISAVLYIGFLIDLRMVKNSKGPIVVVRQWTVSGCLCLGHTMWKDEHSLLLPCHPNHPLAYITELLPTFLWYWMGACSKFGIKKEMYGQQFVQQCCM